MNRAPEEEGATTGRDKRRINGRPRVIYYSVVIAPSGATMTPNGVSTAGRAGSHAWGDRVRHQRLRATVRRSLNQESHGFSRVECQAPDVARGLRCVERGPEVMSRYSPLLRGIRPTHQRGTRARCFSQDSCTSASSRAGSAPSSRCHAIIRSRSAATSARTCSMGSPRFAAILRRDCSFT